MSFEFGFCWPTTRKDSLMGWTGWKLDDGSDVVFLKGCKTNTNVEGEWIHYLVAPADEPSPDKNHIHIKADINGKYVVAAVKVNGIREVNRRKLIEQINRETGLNIKY